MLVALGLVVGLGGLAGVKAQPAGTTALLTAVAPVQRNTITAWTVPAGCGNASAYTLTSLVDQQGTVALAAKDSVVFATATDTVVFANAHTCIVATVPGVDIVNLDGTVHVVLTVLTDVCQTASQLPPPGATRCTWWQQNHPGLVTVLNRSVAPQLAGAITQKPADIVPPSQPTSAAPSPEPSLTPAPGPPPSASRAAPSSAAPSSAAPSSSTPAPTEAAGP